MPLPILPIKDRKTGLPSLSQPKDEKAEGIRKEKFTKNDILLGQDLIDLWIQEGDAISPNNTLVTEILLYCLIGHIFRDIKFPHLLEMGGMDNRIHLLWGQPQRTGKSRLVNGLIEPLCLLSDIGFKMQGIMTGAGGVGGSDASMKGDLELHWDKIFFYDEFMASIHSATSRGSTPTEILDALRMAMNPEGRMSKRLSSVSHEYATRVTLIMTTTLIDLFDIPQQSIKGGFMGRPLCYFRDIGEQDRKKNEKAFCKKARRMDEDAKYNFLRMIQYLKQSIEENKMNISISKDWRDKLASEMELLGSGYGIYYDYLREGSLDKVIKLATIRSIIFESDIIEQLPFARRMEQKLLTISGSWMDLAYGDSDEGISQLVSILKEKEGLTHYELKREHSVFRNNSDLLDRCISKAIREGVLAIKIKDRVRRYYLQDGEEYKKALDERENLGKS